MFRQFDGLCFVEMTPKRVSVELHGNAATSDGVPVTGFVTAQVLVLDGEQTIKRVAADPRTEEELLTGCLLSGFQQAIAGQPWRSVVSITQDFRESIKGFAAAALAEANGCFEIRSVGVEKLNPTKKELAESLERAAQARADEEHQREIAQLRVERAKIEKDAEEQRLRNELEFDRLRKAAELEHEREGLKLAREREQDRLQTQRDLADLLKTEEGRIAALPNETYRFLAKELEVKVIDDKERQRLYRDLLRTSQSFQAGQFNALKAYIAQQYGIQISEDTPASLPMADEDEAKPFRLNGGKDDASKTKDDDEESSGEPEKEEN